MEFIKTNANLSRAQVTVADFGYPFGPFGLLASEDFFFKLSSLSGTSNRCRLWHDVFVIHTFIRYVHSQKIRIPNILIKT
jgi:hypothetical protein